MPAGTNSRVAVSLLIVAGSLVSTATPVHARVVQALPAQSTALAFTGGTVIDVETGRQLEHTTVVVQGTRITAVGPAGSVPVPTGATVVEARGKYLIPGLWDMHVHVWDYPQVAFPLFLAHGVTGIRQMGTGVPLDTVLLWRREVLAGTRAGPPRQIVTGPLLESGGDAYWPETGNRRYVLGVPNPGRARQVVDSLHAAGVDFIKVHDGTWSPEVYFAIAAEARRVGLPFAGHGPGNAVTLLEASDSGQRSIEHINVTGLCAALGTVAKASTPPLAEGPACAAMVRRLWQRGTWLTVDAGKAGLVLRDPVRRTRLRYWPASLTCRLYPWADFPLPDTTADDHSPSTRPRLTAEQGIAVPLLVGTDTGPNTFMWLRVPGFSLHDMLTAMVEDGMTPLAALQAATLNPAKYLQGTDSLGRIAPGQLADLVLLDANPLADIRNTTTIRAVLANGRYFDRAALDALLADVERHGSPWFAAEIPASPDQQEERRGSRAGPRARATACPAPPSEGTGD